MHTFQFLTSKKKFVFVMQLTEVHLIKELASFIYNSFLILTNRHIASLVFTCL